MKRPGAYINGKGMYLFQSLQSIFFFKSASSQGFVDALFIFRKLGFVHFWSLQIANFPESGDGLILDFKSLGCGMLDYDKNVHLYAEHSAHYIILLNTIKLLFSQTPCIVDVKYPKI